MEYLDLLAENTQNQDTTGTYEAPSKTQPHIFSGGMYNLEEDHDLQTKFVSLARKVEAFEFKKSGQLKFVQDILCQICEMNEHATNDCPCNIPHFGIKHNLMSTEKQCSKLYIYIYIYIYIYSWFSY